MELNELEISLCLQEKVNDLVLFVKGNSKSLEAHEMVKNLLYKLLELGKCTMENYFDERQKEEDNSPAIVLENGDVYKNHGAQTRTYFSIFGKIQVQRRVYWSPEKGCIHPLNKNCNLPQDSYSYFLQKIINSLSITESFKDAEKKMKDFFNLDVNDGQIELYGAVPDLYAT